MTILRLLLQNRGLLRIVERPVRFLADIDSIKRWLREKHASILDELREMTIDEREQKRGDVIAVRVGVGEDDDLAVAELVDFEVLTKPAAERGDEIGELFVLEYLGERHALRIENFAAKRKDRLTGAVASLFCRSAGRIALDDEDLARFRLIVGAVAQFPGQIQARRCCALP